MKNNIIVPTDELWMQAIKNLVDDGTLNVEQANTCIKRLQL